ncbi:HTH domain-containing protein [Niabella hirudinis]|uniref:HTH domain-containing protein n=1 Tax=Niabella hirudinis TaxID=1285929 RepID=UPI003EBF2BA4
MQFSKRKPLIEQGINFTRIEFIFSQKGGQKPLLSKRQIEILGMLKEAPSVSRKSLAAAFEINESAIQKHLDALKTKRVIERKGASRGGQWVIKEQ